MRPRGNAATCVWAPGAGSWRRAREWRLAAAHQYSTAEAVAQAISAPGGRDAAGRLGARCLWEMCDQLFACACALLSLLSPSCDREPDRPESRGPARGRPPDRRGGRVSGGSNTFTLLRQVGKGANFYTFTSFSDPNFYTVNIFAGALTRAPMDMHLWYYTYHVHVVNSSLTTTRSKMAESPAEKSRPAAATTLRRRLQVKHIHGEACKGAAVHTEGEARAESALCHAMRVIRREMRKRRTPYRCVAKPLRERVRVVLVFYGLRLRRLSIGFTFLIVLCGISVSVTQYRNLSHALTHLLTNHA